MRTHTKIALLLALIVTFFFFGLTFIQFPTANIVRILGQFTASAAIGIVVFLVTYGIGVLIVRIKK